ncbi:MAG: hypothetical protein NTU79_23600 [Planctomycetota bacterium]|nr:hypothetical protein [Planctomycetota bacterium]
MATFSRSYNAPQTSLTKARARRKVVRRLLVPSFNYQQYLTPGVPLARFPTVKVRTIVPVNEGFVVKPYVKRTVTVVFGGIFHVNHVYEYPRQPGNIAYWGEPVIFLPPARYSYVQL